MQLTLATPGLLSLANIGSELSIHIERLRVYHILFL